MKLAERRGKPLSVDHLLPDVEREFNALQSGERLRSVTPGTEYFEDVMPRYFEFLGKFLIHKVRSFVVAIDANFGLQGKVFEAFVQHHKLPLRVRGINVEPDGTFPKGPPNPLLLDRRDEIVELVKREKADIGVAWDGDGDRCFFVDERGTFQEGYFTTAVLAAEILRDHPGEKIVIDPRLLWATIEAIRAHGGVPVISPPGAVRMSKKLEEVGGIFAGETSSHFLFREFFWRDSGLIPLLMVLQMMSRDQQPLSSYYAAFELRYFLSGELNYKVSDQFGVLAAVEARYKDGKVERTDGFSVEYPEWRFNLRSSNTEPLIRLNIEARRPELIQEKKHELETIIK
ncbi:MAG: phosphomannomutase [Parcubacteria group bacterium]|nr:phosphomannomutase [Parcubacteria group bacterium]